MVNLTDFLQPAPSVRVYHNIGCMFDIPNGKEFIGEHGESYVNGGLMQFTGTAARPNMHKSTLSNFQNLSMMSRYDANGLWYDTENSGGVGRLIDLSAKLDGVGKDRNYYDANVMMYVDKASINYVDDWFEVFKKIADAKEKSKVRLTTPFIDKRTGGKITVVPPTAVVLDSLTQADVSIVYQKIINKNNAGDGDQTEAMTDARAKTVILNQINAVAQSGAMYTTMTGQIGDDIVMDQYAPDKKQLKYLPKGTKLVRCSASFARLPNSLYIINKLTDLMEDKFVKYPRKGMDVSKGDTDLQTITLINMRNKGGQSGRPLDFVVSQSEGLCPQLTHLEHLRGYGKLNKKEASTSYYGIGGNLQTYYLEILPDVKLTRTTVRDKVETDVKLSRALEITSELLQIKQWWQREVPEPKDLYAKLKEDGYDWDILLDTRSYWTYEEQNHPQPYLHSLDLIKMYNGTYRPWWYDAKVKELSKV